MATRASEQIIHKAAWLYYTHGLRQDEVARKLDISRASVAMYLRRARESGIVTISTSTQLFADDVLARQLEDAFGLASAWIVPGDPADGAEGAGVPAVGAGVFLELVARGSRIGVAWGRTIYQLADVMAFADLQDVTVVQLCGNLGAPYSYRPDQCTTEIARRLNARGLNFYAPLVLSSERLAAELRSEPVIQAQLNGIAACDLALFSVGTVDADSHVVACGALSRAEMASLREAGAAGVVAGQLIDGGGGWLDCSYNRRLISADLASIRAIPKRLAVVQEERKIKPLLAALAGGLCSHLVAPAAVARRLLEARIVPAARAVPA